MDLEGYRRQFDELLPTGKGRSYALMWQMLLDIRRLKYCTPSHLKLLNERYSQICAKKKLDKLCEWGYLKNTHGRVYIATDKVLPILKLNGYPIATLPAESQGDGYINELNNTRHFVNALKLENFKAILFPRFPKENPYIIPDALLVIGDEKRYKLIFLEIESEKEDWLNYLDDKRKNYERLGDDIISYNYWKHFAPLLGLPVPEKEIFCFSVMCLGEFKADWRGWRFGDLI